MELTIEKSIDPQKTPYRNGPNWSEPSWWLDDVEWLIWVQIGSFDWSISPRWTQKPLTFRGFPDILGLICVTWLKSVIRVTNSWITSIVRTTWKVFIGSEMTLRNPLVNYRHRFGNGHWIVPFRWIGWIRLKGLEARGSDSYSGVSYETQMGHNQVNQVQMLIPRSHNVDNRSISHSKFLISPTKGSTRLPNPSSTCGPHTTSSE